MPEHMLRQSLPCLQTLSALHLPFGCKVAWLLTGAMSWPAIAPPRLHCCATLSAASASAGVNCLGAAMRAAGAPPRPPPALPGLISASTSNLLAASLWSDSSRLSMAADACSLLRTPLASCASASAAPAAALLSLL